MGTNFSSDINLLEQYLIRNSSNSSITDHLCEACNFRSKCIVDDYMGGALAIGTLLLTSDDQFVFIQRSGRCFEAPNTIDQVGGHPEPSVRIAYLISQFILPSNRDSADFTYAIQSKFLLHNEYLFERSLFNQNLTQLYGSHLLFAFEKSHNSFWNESVHSSLAHIDFLRVLMVFAHLRGSSVLFVLRISEIDVRQLALTNYIPKH